MMILLRAFVVFASGSEAKMSKPRASVDFEFSSTVKWLKMLRASVVFASRPVSKMSKPLRTSADFELSCGIEPSNN